MGYFQFFKKDFIYLFMRGRERKRQRHRVSAGARCGTQSQSPGSCPESKTDTQLLSHPGVPGFVFNCFFMRGRERKRQRHRQKEKQALRYGTRSRALGSCHDSKADALQLSDPGDPGYFQLEAIMDKTAKTTLICGCVYSRH